MAMSVAIPEVVSMPIAALTREHGGWEQACLRTSDERSRVQCLVPARSDGARHWTKAAPRFPATESPGTTRTPVRNPLQPGRLGKNASVSVRPYPA